MRGNLRAAALVVGAGAIMMTGCADGRRSSSVDQDWGLGTTRLAAPVRPVEPASPTDMVSAPSASGAPVALGPTPPVDDVTPSAAASVAATMATVTETPAQAPPVVAPPTLLEQAHHARAAGDVVEAVALYRAVLADEPDALDALLGLSHALIESGKVEEAAPIAAELAKKHPRNDRILALLARTSLAEGDLTGAATHIFVASARSPQERDVQMVRGMFEDLRGDHAAAQRQYQAALRGDALDIAVYNNMAVSQIAAGDFNSALATLLPLTNGPVPGRPTIRHNLALAYGLMGREADARTLLAIDLSPQEIAGNLAYYKWARERMGQPAPETASASPAPRR